MTHTLSAAETRDFAERLMKEVWETFDHTALPRFYHADMVGHHRDQTLTLDDVSARLQWDVLNFGEPVYDIRNLVAGEDEFAIRFVYTCTMIKTGEKFRTEVIYFYRLEGGKVAEFWLLSDAAFDYKMRP
jgi:predicted ester cyclase